MSRCAVKVIEVEPLLIPGKEVARLLGVSYEAVMHGDGICAQLVKVDVGNPKSTRARWNFDYAQVMEIGRRELEKAHRQQAWRRDRNAEEE
ncbi:MAG: hypothetical protein WBV94_24780 [Blastocatellia bacterium]